MANADHRALIRAHRTSSLSAPLTSHFARPASGFLMDSPSRTATLSPPDEVALVKERERAGRDLGARTYLEKLEHSRGPFRFRAEIRTLVHFIAPRRGQDVLDAGSGVGRYALDVAPRVRRLVCADLSPVALDVLRERAAAQGLANIETRVCDLADLPGELGPFDTIYSSEVLQHVPGYDEHMRVMRALHRALKPGGRCLVNVVCWNRRSHSPKV